MRTTAHGARALAVASLSLASLFGCASIIGLDDYTVAGHAGQGGTPGPTDDEAGASGEAGATGQGEAGQGGAPTTGGAPTSGGAPTAGAAPTAGDGGEAGQPSEVPPIVGCDGVTSFQPSEGIVTSCIIRAGCNPNFNPVRNISTCVTFDTQQALPGEACTQNATSCAEYEECEHLGIAKDDLCGGSQVTRCDGNIAVNCDNYVTNQFSDCEALGGTCAVYDYQGTNYADCKLDVSPDIQCLTETDENKYFCHSGQGKADLRYYCWEGEAYGSSCSNLAYCDGDQASGDATCYFELPTCGNDSVTCKNNIANVCSSGSLFKYDCAAVGLTCGVTAGTEYCFAPGCKAADVDSKCTESCSDDGTQLTFCYGGAPYTVDCADYGFSQCKSDVDDNQVPFAACRL